MTDAERVTALPAILLLWLLVLCVCGGKGCDLAQKKDDEEEEEEEAEPKGS